MCRDGKSLKSCGVTCKELAILLLVPFCNIKIFYTPNFNASKNELGQTE